MPKTVLSIYRNYSAETIGWGVACLSSIILSMAMYSNGAAVSIWECILIFFILVAFPGIIIGAIACWIVSAVEHVVHIVSQAQLAMPASRYKKAKHIHAK